MKLEDALKKATWGPWEVHSLVWAKNGEATGAECLTPEVQCQPWATTGKLDMRLAAHAFNMLPKLIEALERLRDEAGLYDRDFPFVAEVLAEAKEVKV